MSLPRFYSPIALTVGSLVELASSAAHHAVKVLRLRVGDGLILFDGEGGEYTAAIERIDKKLVLVNVQSHQDIERESPLVITLVQAVSSRDRMDVTLQKAVELGVARIIPVMSQRSLVRLDGERAEQRMLHWQQVVIAACEQCGRNRVPQVEALVPLANFLQRPGMDAGRWMLSPRAEQALRTQEKPQAAMELLVGPEGGLSNDEESAAVNAGYRPVRLGPRILRTETAAPALLAALQALWGDF